MVMGAAEKGAKRMPELDAVGAGVLGGRPLKGMPPEGYSSGWSWYSVR
jgi:hypothetical protein